MRTVLELPARKEALQARFPCSKSRVLYQALAGACWASSNRLLVRVKTSLHLSSGTDTSTQEAGVRNRNAKHPSQTHTSMPSQVHRMSFAQLSS